MLLASLVSSFTLTLSKESHTAIVSLFIYLDEEEAEWRKGGSFQPNYPGDALGHRVGLLCDMNSNETFTQG